MADTAGRLSPLPRRGRTVNPVSFTSVDGSRGGGPGSPASPSCHGPSDSAEASVYGSGTSCHVLPWLLSLLISRTRIPRLSGFTASVILSLDVTICELRADASVKTRGNNHTRSSPGGTGHTVNDKMPLGTNLERVWIVNGTTSFPHPRPPKHGFGCRTLWERQWAPPSFSPERTHTHTLRRNQPRERSEGRRLVFPTSAPASPKRVSVLGRFAP